MTEEQTDLSLLERWRAGDNTAGSALVKRHFAALERFFASKVQAPHEDLIQQTFVACVEAKNSLANESSVGSHAEAPCASTFRGYLLSLARLQLYVHYRKDSRERKIEFTTTSVRDLSPSPTGVLVRREEQRLLMYALQHIPVDQQIALELTYWEGLSAPDIACVLGIPENTVYSRVRRAKTSLKNALCQLSELAYQRERALGLLDPTEDAEAGDLDPD
jgi:RNA polymerase sigma-70 factor (ECF subfamily)